MLFSSRKLPDVWEVFLEEHHYDRSRGRQPQTGTQQVLSISILLSGIQNIGFTFGNLLKLGMH
jgi:hypothetical protein